MLELLGLATSFDPDDFSGDKYLGEITPEELISGVELASLCGYSTGIAHNNDIGWLKFEINGRTIFVAKRSFRYRVSWNSMDSVGIIDGTRVLTIKDKQYKIRLLKGAEKDPSGWTTAMGQTDPPIVARSEWNRLIYPVSVNGPGTKRWANFSNTDLGIVAGNGRVALCQEKITSLPSYNMARGNAHVNQVNYVLRSDGTAGTNFNHYGWRPVLELV